MWALLGSCHATIARFAHHERFQRERERTPRGTARRYRGIDTVNTVPYSAVELTDSVPRCARTISLAM